MITQYRVCQQHSPWGHMLSRTFFVTFVRKTRLTARKIYSPVMFCIIYTVVIMYLRKLTEMCLHFHRDYTLTYFSLLPLNLMPYQMIIKCTFKIISTYLLTYRVIKLFCYFSNGLTRYNYNCCM